MGKQAHLRLVRRATRTADEAFQEVLLERGLRQRVGAAMRVLFTPGVQTYLRGLIETRAVQTTAQVAAAAHARLRANGLDLDGVAIVARWDMGQVPPRLLLRADVDAVTIDLARAEAARRVGAMH
jgi:metal-dependent amidase/aminoacylase/carboxypeptidase family protein